MTDTPQTDFQVDNKKFTKAVIDYGRARKQAEHVGEQPPRVNNYIGDCIYRICSGVSMRPNFRYYSFREEMVSDAIENCLKAIGNYDPDAATRSGNPNAHGYFSQIAYWAMVRRIQTEEKETNIKIELINRSAIDSFVSAEDADSIAVVNAFMNDLKSSTSSLEKKKKDAKTKHHGWNSPTRDSNE